MAATIDFNSVIRYSKKNCGQKSQSLCATYVKKAFQAGGCLYTQGDGWNNQNFCRTNDFKLIGDFIPVDGNPRPHNGMAIQFPPNYKQQIGDICLIQHGTYGHICYAFGKGIDDWVSDYFQRPPGQQAGTGPYCYQGGYQRVQFWRHSSVMAGAPEVTEIAPTGSMGTDYSSQPIGVYKKPDNPITPQRISSMSNLDNDAFGHYSMLLGTSIRQK